MMANYCWDFTYIITFHQNTFEIEELLNALEIKEAKVRESD